MKPRSKFIKNLSASTVQLVINQTLGVFIFYILSTQLDKATFGSFNLALAITLTSFGILSFGIDQLVIKKIATGENISDAISTYFFHVIITGSIFYLLILLSYFLFPAPSFNNYLLLFVAVGKLFNYFSTPFKQLPAGLERFGSLLFMSVGSNVVKVISLLLLYWFNKFSIEVVLLVFILADLIELVLSYLIAKHLAGVTLSFNFSFKNYKRVIKEAFPQIGTLIFSATLARLDWILIGVFLSATRLADYSFAYKAFEMATLPLLVLAPLLIPKFAKTFRVDPSSSDKNYLRILLSIELMIASLTSLVLVVLWVPVIDFVTDGKYGYVNRNTIFFLALSIPFLYFNNFLWTINFSRGKLRLIFFIFAMTFTINLIADVFLIPVFSNEGAAAGYLVAVISQSIFFVSKTRDSFVDDMVYPLFVCPVCAFGSVLVCSYFFQFTSIILTTSIVLYLVSVCIFLKFSLSQYRMVRGILKG